MVSTKDYVSASENGDGTRVKRHQCEVCGERFEKFSQYIVHSRKHTGERPFTCDVCGNSYSRAQHLQRHKRTHDKNFIKSLRAKCSKCNEEFANETCLKKHVIRFHDLQLSSRKRFKCPEEGCGAVFLRKIHLAKHEVSHSKTGTTKMKLHTCPHEGCNRKFDYPGRLKLHMKVHEGYKCDVDGCDAVLCDYHALRSHKAAYHPLHFLCLVCNKSFKKRTLLENHMLTHDESRCIYQCTWEGCSRSFLYAKNLKQHIRQNHHGEDIWTTHVRNRKFKRQSSTTPNDKKTKVQARKSLAERLCGVKAKSSQSRSKIRKLNVTAGSFPGQNYDTADILLNRQAPQTNMGSTDLIQSEKESDSASIDPISEQITEAPDILLNYPIPEAVNSIDPPRHTVADDVIVTAISSQAEEAAKILLLIAGPSRNKDV